MTVQKFRVCNLSFFKRNLYFYSAWRH